MEFIVIFGVVIAAVVVVAHNMSNRREKDAIEDMRIAKEKFAALGDRIKTMTILQIVLATGDRDRWTTHIGERWVRGVMFSRKLVCADYDGREAQKRFDAEEGKSESQLRAEQMESKRIGVLSPKVKCPHCDTVGQVYKKTNATQTETTQSSRLTAAVLEGQKITTKKVTQFHCKNCETTWNI
jgi:excinuclease UvrABC ATPase subunit